MPNPAIPLVDAPPAASRIQTALERAKARSEAAAPVPPLQGTPRFDQLPARAEAAPGPAGPPPSRVSPETEAALEALARANTATRTAPPPTRYLQSEEAPETEDEPTTPQSDLDRLRAAVEARLKPLDVGQHLMGTGEVLQRVPIIPGKLEPVFRTATAYEEGWVDAWIFKQGELTNRQYSRKMAEVSLAFAIHSLGAEPWPVTLDKVGRVLDEHVEDRLNRVRKLPSSVFRMLTQNMGWFVERVDKSLTSEALGNG